MGVHSTTDHNPNPALLTVEKTGHYQGSVIKRREPEFPPCYYERFPRLLSKENKRKIELKEILSCLIPRLLVLFTRQLEILVTTLHYHVWTM